MSIFVVPHADPHLALSPSCMQTSWRLPFAPARKEYEYRIQKKYLFIFKFEFVMQSHIHIIIRILAIDIPGKVGNDSNEGGTSIVRLISGALIVLKGALWLLMFFGHVAPTVNL